MSQTSLFEEKDKSVRWKPAIYTYANLPINRKINFRSAPMNLYGACKENITKGIFRERNEDKPYGLCRGYLDYSLSPNEDHRK